jgi:DNA-binding transcriptional LysR family regulator
MPNLRAIETFVKALEGGSIASAARQLGISPAAASQNIARLERELGTRLITRTTRSMALTEAGERYLARVAPVLDELEKAQSDLSLIHGELQGRLRIACMAAFGRHVLAPLLPAFTALHPRLELELLITDRHVDVLKEDVDISVRYRDVLEPGMSVRLLASVPRILCALAPVPAAAWQTADGTGCSNMPVCCIGASATAGSCAGPFCAMASAPIRSRRLRP